MDVLDLTNNSWTEQLIRSLKTETLEDLSYSIDETGFETRATNAPDDPETILFIDELQRIGKIVESELERRNITDL